MALVVYKGSEDIRYKERATAMIESPEFNRPIVKSILSAFTAGAQGAIQQLKEESYLSRDPSPNFLNRRRLIENKPPDLYPKLTLT